MPPASQRRLSSVPVRCFSPARSFPSFVRGFLVLLGPALLPVPSLLSFFFFVGRNGGASLVRDQGLRGGNLAKRDDREGEGGEATGPLLRRRVRHAVPGQGDRVLPREWQKPNSNPNPNPNPKLLVLSGRRLVVCIGTECASRSLGLFFGRLFRTRLARCLAACCFHAS